MILAHGFGGLKEWTIPEVAGTLVDAGIAAPAFDYGNFGDSDGESRGEVDHTGQIEDWRNAVTFATTLPDPSPALAYPQGGPAHDSGESGQDCRPGLRHSS